MRKILKSFFIHCVVALMFFTSFSLQVNASNVSLANNKYIKKDQYYSGYLGSNTSKVFRFSFSAAQKVTFRFTAYGEGCNLGSLIIYNSNGNEVYKDYIEENSAVNTKTQQFIYYLPKGTYYAVIENFYGYKGNYKFKYSLSQIKRETQSIYSSTSTAKKIYVGKSYTDFVSFANRKNVYKAVLNKSTSYRLKFDAYSKYSDISIYSKDGKLLYNFYGYPSSLNKVSLSKKINLKKGTYYIVVDKYYTYSRTGEGIYSFRLSYA